MNRIVSVDLKADFGFLKKPDTNDPIYLTFNMLHKPALIGIFGAILGLGGFSESKKEEKKRKKGEASNNEEFLPEYYKLLNSLKVGIKPLDDERGNFEKTIIKYNNGVGYANLDGGNLIVVEQTLINPSFRCYFLVETALHEKLAEYLKENKAEFLPYLGKNDFSIWWKNYQEYEAEEFNSVNESFKLDTIFIKKKVLKEGLKELDDMQILMGESGNTFVYFENLPTEYQIDLMQYSYQPFAYTDWNLKQNYHVENLFKLSNNETIQVF
jgi:CRISPR-associated protein Cas5h